MVKERKPFPHEIDEFEKDTRVSFSKVDKKWILEDPDGSEWEFDEKQKRWFASLDEALLEQQRKAYAVEGVDEAEPAKPQNKRKKSSEEEDGGAGNAKKPRAQSNKATERKNTAVYVTSIPLDADAEEINSIFSKCGVIAEEIDRGKPRIKLYMDDEGKFKGDALIVYFRHESVELAIQMLDDSEFRFGQEGPLGKMRVTEADFSYKRVQDKPDDQKRNSKDKKKVIRKTQKMKNKLADWDDDDPQSLHESSSRWDKVVILRHMFTLQELDEDPAAMLDIKEDVREECAKLGEVTNVQLFDREEDGVVSVRFSTVEAAKACVKLMDGRTFSGQKIDAYIADGSEKFKKTKDKKVSMSLDSDEDEEENKRLDEFGEWLGKDNGSKEG